MLQTPRATGGMVVAPHHLAAQSGLAVLRDGGNAIEAMVAAAASIAAVYPHMNGIGGDGFWLISNGGPPVGIDACGAAAMAVDHAYFQAHGHKAIPSRGPHAAITVPGTVSGWETALEISQGWGGRLPLSRLLADAIAYARDGVPVTRSLHDNLAAKGDELRGIPGFADAYFRKSSYVAQTSELPPVGALHRNPALAQTFERLAQAGLGDFYRGELSRAIALDLMKLGSPLVAQDLAAHRARRVSPLSLKTRHGTVYNMPPPTQGLASLMLIGIYERLGITQPETFAYVHGLIEATKQAFRVRDAEITDPAYMANDPARFLQNAELERMARAVNPSQAAVWGLNLDKAGDTVWLGAIDGDGRSVSFIQSLYWEFGSGVTLPETGITMQNRGTSFSLEPTDLNFLRPGRRPFHTIQPALALLDDGRNMVYGTMGGEGQPQTQAMLYSRHVIHGQEPQAAVSAPRWLLGRTWGAESSSLRIEDRWAPDIVDGLRDAGHPVEVVDAFDAITGHAGLLIRNRDGVIAGGADPRSDGAIAAF